MDNNRCITIDETSMTDGSKSHRGVQRCRDTDVTSSGSVKRRKLDVSSAEFGSCDHVLSSSCFSNCLRLDLKDEVHTEAETFMSVDDGFSGVTSSSSEICLDSDHIETFSRMKKKPPPRAVTCRRKPLATAAKLPTAMEIEEFFAVAEKKEQKRFSDKYNFDVVNDVPMDGRYQWVGLKP
ncbi:putative cyclin-dependent kinase inhibitor [Helianthus annuus]|uniref:Cyclin-dependent kinase inhibitor n=1 Tax=Helianthus annuus TaxID=4232 RepID=A0A251RVW3_HELAN|nr:cyclin-dependent kinase inhibitor 7 [Helianthus annuus]KAF5760369.1 putative cyclin-dependent kinase inhibitor [Helianthus annuus]KAJ0438433.1 putative cyclin-dependent kinase inhibitor domain-containing protein [Helianthus annuus]KAJ0443183.1 putative cyclin-dependent kinase inhibitor [Helianthus annuus]KAJ0460757.1 putative cyclin-dependent kinase inhibitor domain-containing protein [Helianthus annuus]KAJ0645086.1 putative cyclin-dependent kinase inhibitor domain-containing protein [Helia